MHRIVWAVCGQHLLWLYRYSCKRSFEKFAGTNRFQGHLGIHYLTLSFAQSDYGCIGWYGIIDERTVDANVV